MISRLVKFKKRIAVLKKTEHNVIHKTEQDKFHFKMFNDDRNLNCESLSKINFSFDSLDEKGYGVGCTDIHYLGNDKYAKI